MSDFSAMNAQSNTQSDLQGLVVPPEGHCFHCGDPLPQQPFFADVLGEKRPMCCLGCQLASQSIVEAATVPRSVP